MARASFKASDLGQGGGLYEGPIKVSNARFGKSNYNGKAEAPATALLITAEHLDANGDLTEEEMIFSVGKGWEPSEDGDMPSDSGEGAFIVSEKDGAKLNQGSAFGLLLASFDKCGYEIDGDKGADDLNGRMFNVKREAAPTPQKKDRVVYIVDTVLDEVPWEPKRNKAKVASPKAANPVEKAESNGTVDGDTLISIAQSIVNGAGSKGLKMADVPQAVAKTIATWPNPAEKKTLLSQRADIVAALDSDFFNSNADIIAYNEKTGVLTTV